MLMMSKMSDGKVVFKGEEMKYVWYTTVANIYIIGKEICMITIHDQKMTWLFM